jgi:hypothetical protein
MDSRLNRDILTPWQRRMLLRKATGISLCGEYPENQYPKIQRLDPGSMIAIATAFLQMAASLTDPELRAIVCFNAFSGTLLRTQQRETRKPPTHPLVNVGIVWTCGRLG